VRVKTIPSTWISRDGRRFDCGPYMSGALEAKIRLEGMSCRKKRLADLCEGGADGIYHAGRESRTWVDDPKFGVPFLSSSSILAADLSGLPLISKKQVAANPRFTLRPGWTLITRSGTIGRMVYARPDMDGLACSEHVMRVVPDIDKVRPGYLFAFLSSKFGVPLVTSGTYGSIIQSIEPQHIADLPVPRLGDDVERSAHELVEGAANLRAVAARMLAAAVRELEQSGGLQPLPPSTSPTPFSCTTVSATALQERFDAFFHSPYGNSVVALLKASHLASKTVASIADSIVEPARFKRIRTDDPTHGVRFFGTSALMWSEPIEMYYLPKAQLGMDQYIVSDRTVLVPRSGQLSGIIGTAVLPYGNIIGGAVSEDAIRINCPDLTTAGFVFVALTSQYGLRQLKARAYGSSIPHLDVYQIGRVVLPDPGKKVRRRIGDAGAEVARLRDEAVAKDREARALVEHTIEEAD
jgi:type I restriction enzyme S subunit